jgi:hypothetical protein
VFSSLYTNSQIYICNTAFDFTGEKLEKNDINDKNFLEIDGGADIKHNM